VALRYEKAWEEGEPEETEQYQLFATSQYRYRVFVTALSEPVPFVVWFYNQRGGAENLTQLPRPLTGFRRFREGRVLFSAIGTHTGKIVTNMCNHFPLH
jgi:hypothetical protein